MDQIDFENGIEEKPILAYAHKVHSPVSSGMIGIILAAIGYEVDSVTDTFLGELSALPTMPTLFIVITGLVLGI